MLDAKTCKIFQNSKTAEYLIPFVLRARMCVRLCPIPRYLFSKLF